MKDFLRKASAFFGFTGSALYILYLVFCPPAFSAEAYRPGPYAGISVGVGAEQLTADNFDLGSQGVVAGGLAGWTFALNSWVVGLEGNVGWNGVKGKWTESSATLNSDGSYYAGIRARAGVPIGPVLIFGMVGPSFQEMKISVDQVSNSKVQLGLTAGAGVDLQLTNTMVIRFAGEHTWWKDTNFDLGKPALLETGKEDTKFYGALIFNLN